MSDIFSYAQQLQQLLVLAYNKIFYDTLSIFGIGYGLLFLILIVLIVCSVGVFKVASAVRELTEMLRWKDRE